MNDAGELADSGTCGELWLAGSQVAAGYWNAPEETAARFVRGADGRLWFRTGDLARKGGSPDGCLQYLGRRHDQVKIRGFRVELLEVDAALRQASGTADALALAWPPGEAAEMVVGVVARQGAAPAGDIVDACRKILPDFMVPRRVVMVDEVPRGVNGKLDRQQLATLIANGNAL
jgi:acyl-CoA synthetase (AMP-forming)/AMP-acid ligase II